MPHPLLSNSTALKGSSIPSNRFAEMLWSQRTAWLLKRDHFRPTARKLTFHDGWRRCWKIGLLLVRVLDPFGLYPARALDNISYIHLGYRAHSNDNVFGY